MSAPPNPPNPQNHPPNQGRSGKGNIAAIHGLTPMQEGMLFHVLQAPRSGLYIEQYACRVDGPLDVEALRRAWTWAIERHEVLRTFFTWERGERPLQVVRTRVETPWQVEDWRAAAGGGSGATAPLQSRLERWLAEDRERGFALQPAPLMRLTVARLDEASHQFLWSFHHLLLDGWSMRLVLHEVFEAYEAFARGDTPTAAPVRPFGEYVAWLRARDPVDDTAFWRRVLQGFDAPTPLLGTSPQRRDFGSAPKDHVDLDLSESATTALQEGARAQRLTMNTLLRGAWGLLLARNADASDVVFGATVSGRPPDLDDIEARVGLFINTIPVRVRIPEDARVSEWLATLQAGQLDATPHEYAPLVEVQKCSEVRGVPLFRSLLVVQNVPADPAGDTAPSVTRTDERYLERSHFPMVLLVFPGSRLRVRFVYDRELFDPASIERLSRQFERILRSFVENPDARLEDVSLVSPEEWANVLVEWNRTDAPLPRRGDLAEQILESAHATPSAVAVACGDHELTYAELAARAADLAHHLQERGVGPEVRVAIALDRSIEMIVGIVGILQAGGAYVPIDPEQPAERVRLILEDIQSPLVLTRRNFIERLRDHGLPLLALDGMEVSEPDHPDRAAETAKRSALRAPGGAPGGASGGASGNALDRLAYVLYTSGSTGTPRGVEVTHANLVHSNAARVAHYREPVARYCLLSPFVFDSSVAGIFWTLGQGGTLVLPPPRAELDVDAIAQLIEARQVTHLLALPALYALLLEHAAPRSLRSLAVAIVAGEACPAEVARLHHVRVPGATLHNEYGPTEATVWSTVYEIPREVPPRIPIGRPVGNMRAFVLDRRQRPAAPGLPGELYLAGPGVARGYLNDPGRTVERFVQLDLPLVGRLRLYRTGDRVRLLPDGNLEFLGRVDHQVKVRGHRIELGEVESALRAQPGVRDAAVILRDTADVESTEALTARLQSIDESAARDWLDRVEALTDDAAAELLERQE